MLIGRNFGDTWTLPLAEMLIIVLIVLLSVVLAVRGPIKRLRNMSVVDTLRAQ